MRGGAVSRAEWPVPHGVAYLAVPVLFLAAACFSGDADPSGILPDDCAALAEQAGIPTGTTVVGIRDFEFIPATVTVTRGQSVAWVNCEPEGGVAHTSTADDGGWDSPLLARGEVFLQVIGDPGSHTYHCAPHPFMTGTVVVE